MTCVAGRCKIVLVTFVRYNSIIQVFTRQSDYINSPTVNSYAKMGQIAVILPLLHLTFCQGNCANIFGPSGLHYIGVPITKSIKDPTPCRPRVLKEQVNYICSNDQIWCLPGWKVQTLPCYLFHSNLWF